MQGWIFPAGPEHFKASESLRAHQAGFGAPHMDINVLDVGRQPLPWDE